MQAIIVVIQISVKNLFDQNVEPVLTRPDEQFGDYATNIALQLAGKLNMPPRDIAEQIVSSLHKTLGNSIQKVTLA